MSKRPNEACAVCGRRAKRTCPALDGAVCNSCCASRRGTRIDCPPECPYFPFGREAYNRWLQVDGMWQTKALKYVIGKVGEEQFKNSAEHYAPPWIKEESAFLEGANAALMNYLTTGKGDDSPSIGEIWKREEWIGLNNDERYMSEYRCRSQPGIIEVQKILDDKAMECIDLLDMERGRFIVFDRNTASAAARFTKIMVWITHYPHFTRLSGAGIYLPDSMAEQFLAEIRHRAKEAMHNKSDEAVKHYLSEHFAEAYELLEELRHELRERLISSLDSDWCRAYYRLLAPRGEIESVLGEKPDFEPEEDRTPEPDDPPDAAYYTWLRRGEAKLIEKEAPGLIQHANEEEDGVGLLGNVLLTNDILRLETRGRVLFRFAKKLIKSYFKKKLKFMNNDITPIRDLLEKHADSDNKREKSSDAIPPEIEALLAKKFYEKHYAGFIDGPVPMLGGMTPRQASHLPAMRPKLIELIKLHLHRIDNIRIDKGIDINIDWIVDELGLDELK